MQETAIERRVIIILCFCWFIKTDDADDATAQSPRGGMGEPAMAAEQSPGVGMQRDIAQLQQDMKEAREDAARLRDVINVLMQRAAAKDLGRKPITVVPGRASGQWWDEVEAGWNVCCMCVVFVLCLDRGIRIEATLVAPVHIFTCGLRKTGSMHCTAFSTTADLSRVLVFAWT